MARLLIGSSLVLGLSLYTVQLSTPTRLWTDAAGRPTADAREAVALLERAAADGLAPRDYGTDVLRAELTALGSAPGLARGEAFEAALTGAVSRYLRDLHGGRVDPRSVGFTIPPRPPLDAAEAMGEAVARHRLTAAAAELTPQIPAYQELRVVLARYRALAADATLEPPEARAPRDPEGACRDRLRIWRLLLAFGDVPASAGMPDCAATAGGGAFQDGVTRFQARHGLAPDGVAGPATRAALRVPIAWRVRQIELSLERLRWVPNLTAGRFVAVNIPMFRLRAFDGGPSAERPAFTSKVIVGRALNTRTPVMLEELERVIFRPSWNVPASIVQHEILPALTRDPSYLRRHDMELTTVDGTVRVRQRPGPANSLGLVKFDFPNEAGVYMHGTPAPELFDRARRDFSHGCIRVADPVGLAEWVLAGEGAAREPAWTRERVLAAMHAPSSRRVDLAHPVPVVLFYLTAVVAPEDGAVHFAGDIYGHDARLHRALENSCGSETS